MTATITRFVDDITGDLLENYGVDLLKALEAENEFEVNANVVNWLLDEVPGLMGQVNGTTRDALRASLVEGAALNEDVAELVARVTGIFAAAQETRAPIIGDTFATKIMGFTTQEAARQAGFEKKRWLSSQDQVVRGSHEALNGQTVNREDKFQSPSGAAAMHPGAFGVASEDIGCRCAMRPVPEGEKAANMTDKQFRAFTEKQHIKTSRKIAQTFNEVLKEQKGLVLKRLRVVLETP